MTHTTQRAPPIGEGLHTTTMHKEAIRMKPVIHLEELTRFDGLRLLYQTICCPACGQRLDAVPDDLPECCGRCGEALDFTDVEFIDDEIIGTDAADALLYTMRRI